MIKTRLAINADGHPLRLVLLYEWAYSDGADLSLGYWNTNEESGPGFRVSGKKSFRGQKLSMFSCSQNMTEKVYDNHHELTLILRR